MTERTICLAIAEKNPLLARELASYLEVHGPFKVAMLETDAQPIIDAAPSGRFDIAIIGWEMADIEGDKAIATLRKHSAVKVIIYTGCARDEVPYQALALGAAGFCSKAEAPERLVGTILTVAEGRMAYPLLDVSRFGEEPPGNLTPKEHEVLKEVASGYANKEIAIILGVSLNTVKFHIKNIYDKLGFHNRAQAATYLYNKEWQNEKS